MKGGSRPPTRKVLALVVLGAILAACTPGAAHPAAGNTTATLPAIPFKPGSPWSGALVPLAPPTPVNSLVAVTCATASRCWAVGSTVGSGGAPNGAALIATTNGGASWVNQPIPATAAYLSAVACSTPVQCVAVGEGQGNQGVAIATTNGGTSWTQASVPAGIGDVTTVTCRSDRRCLAIGSLAAGDAALVSTSAGVTWSQTGTLSGGTAGASGVSCVDDQHCWVTGHTLVGAVQVAGAVVATANGGTSWSTIAIPPGSGSLNAVSCVQGPADQSGSVPGSTAGGQVTVPTQPTSSAPTTTSPPTAGLAGVRCAVVGTTATTPNVARIGHGLVFTTANGGATWASQPAPTSVAAFFGVWCIGVDTCAAVGSAVASSPTAGVLLFTGSAAKPWKGATTITSPEPLLGMACTSSSQCVAVGESVIERVAGP
ncbi:MAG TPA: hypothetical protein VG205_11590 [Acidimicrobiales bacterium]|nr:hypothetical protein [Acidimicrobiales bacterium]